MLIVHHEYFYHFFYSICDLVSLEILKHWVHVLFYFEQYLSLFVCIFNNDHSRERSIFLCEVYCDRDKQGTSTVNTSHVISGRKGLVWSGDANNVWISPIFKFLVKVTKCILQTKWHTFWICVFWSVFTNFIFVPIELIKQYLAVVDVN